MRRHRLSRTHSAQLKAKAAKLREVAGDDPQAVAVADAFLAVDEMIAAGYTLREGGGERTKPVPLPKELQPYAAQWAKPPPER